jgi:hypothetical protein
VECGQFPDQVIEHAAEVVDGVTEDLAQLVSREWAEYSYEIPEADVEGVRVVLDLSDESVGIWLVPLSPGSNESLERVQVLMCPVEFEPDGSGEFTHGGPPYAADGRR